MVPWISTATLYSWQFPSHLVAVSGRKAFGLVPFVTAALIHRLIRVCSAAI